MRRRQAHRAQERAGGQGHGQNPARPEATVGDQYAADDSRARHRVPLELDFH